MGFSLLPHQVDAVDNLDTGKVLVGDVGSGKSITAFEYARRAHPDLNIVVITTAKKRESAEWFADAMKMSLRQEVHVDSWNNIAKYTDIEEPHFFIFDEQRVVGNGAWVEHFYSITARHPWVLLSATPADVWMDLIPVFVANGFYQNKTDFCRNHVVWVRYAKFPKVERYFDEHILEKFQKMVYVEMPDVRKTVRHEHITKVGFDAEIERRIFKDRWNVYENKPIKDAGEMIALLRRVSTEHWSRLEAARSICKDTPRIIIFYNHNHELEELRTLGDRLGRPIAEWNGHKHQPIPDSPEWIYLVQYRAGAEGWNCIDTDTILFYSLTYSYRDFHQAKGRIDRLNTKFIDLHYHILKSDSMADKMIWKALKSKKNFNIRRFAKITWAKMTDTPTHLGDDNVHSRDSVRPISDELQFQRDRVLGQPS